jgi:SAM-dependent methyltransferase
MSKNHWDGIYRGHRQQEPGSPRFAEIAAGVKGQVSAVRGRILLLGVTPMLADIGSDVTAVDRNHAVVRTRWIGNAPSRRVVIADWRWLPFGAGVFSVGIGDGSICALQYPDDVGAVYENLSRVLRAGGRFVCRVYLTPDAGESVAEVARAAWQGRCRSFLYFKFRLAMAIAAEQSEPSVPVQSIHAAFHAQFPDRDRLAEATGWDRSEIDNIDHYQGSPEIYNFPTRRQALSMVPSDFVNARFVPVGSYELAERCPLLVMEKR